MIYLLDTNICIYLMQQNPAPVAARFASLRIGDVGISTVTLAELEHGTRVDEGLAATRRAQLDRLLALIPAVEFDAAAARRYGELRALPRRLGRNRFDILIAASALARGLVLVTNNQADFEGIEGLKVENWID